MIMPEEIDSFRFITGITRRVLKTWIKMEQPRDIPWTPLTKPISESTVAIISTGGIAHKDDQPFDQEGERQNPWWGDPSYRVHAKHTKTEDIRLYHLHVNPANAERDLNCLFPLERLLQLEQTGEVGRAAEHHYSIMGYILQPEELLEKTVPQIINCLNDDSVNAVLLVPA
jgi:D-proline reductase (dithiol) PrdB